MGLITIRNQPSQSDSTLDMLNNLRFTIHHLPLL